MMLILVSVILCEDNH